MAKKTSVLEPQIKAMLGFDESEADDTVMSAWKAASTRVCKPCWELKYCPYGPLVEDFPLLPPTKKSAEEHSEYLKRCLQAGTFGEGQSARALTEEERTRFQGMIAAGDDLYYPEEIPEEISEMSCRVFGHLCPVVFVAEGLTETSDSRRVARSISPRVMMRVARRDNYMCQLCSTPLKDYDIEFDHIIPFAKGGSSEEHNIRVTCLPCNRKKSDTLTIDLIS